MKKILIIALSAALLLTACGSSNSSTEKNETEKQITTWTTKSGQICKVYADAPDDYKTATIKTIEQLAPGSDTDQLYSKSWPFSLYDDGMAEISIPTVVVNGYEYGGEIMMEFTDDEHTNFSVHYLKIGPDVYRDDGTYNLDDYSEAE